MKTFQRNVILRNFSRETSHINASICARHDRITSLQNDWLNTILKGTLLTKIYLIIFIDRYEILDGKKQDEKINNKYMLIFQTIKR